MPSSKVLVAKTSLDGHWRGVMVIAATLREAGFEVIQIGMANADAIASAARDEDVSLVGLNVGGRVEVVERVVAKIHEVAGDIPIMAGGTIPPWAARRLEEQGIPVFPPGSSLASVVETARRLVAAGGAPDDGQGER